MNELRNVKKLRTEYKFTLPKGTGVPVEPGRKASGTMRLIRVEDLVDIERDGKVRRETGEFYVVLLSRCIKELGTLKNINRNHIERLEPIDFAFLVDFMNEINHQVIKNISVACEKCGNEFTCNIAQLGEA